MERIKQPIRKKLPQVKLYLGDLIQIIEILKDNNFQDIEITTPTHKYNENELNEIQRETLLSEIKSHKPFYLSIFFNNSFGEGIIIYSEIDSSLAEGVIQKISNLLFMRKRYFFSLVSNVRVVIFAFFTIQMLSLFLEIKKMISDATWGIICLGVIFFLFFLMFLDSGKVFRKNLFYFKTKEEQPSFWIRKSDEITVGIIVAIITVIVTIVIQQLFK